MKRSLFQRIYRGLLGHPVARWIVIAGTLIYLLSPIDIIPDAPFVGWIDDGVLVTLVATGLTDVILERRRNLKAKKTEEEAQNGTQSTVDTSATPADDPAQP